MLPFQPFIRQNPVFRFRFPLVTRTVSVSAKWTNHLLVSIGSLGADSGLNEHERRKHAIFNQLCFFQLITGTFIPLLGALHGEKLPNGTWLMACLPALASVIVLVLNAFRKFETAFYCYFLLYPLFISIVYLNRLDLGIELSFILCGILSVFFLKEVAHILIAVAFSMISYFVLILVRKQSAYPPLPVDELVYVVNQVLTIVYIFYGLYLIMKENVGYQSSLLETNYDLREKNIEIEKQQLIIWQKAQLLEKQTKQLKENDRVRNKLFSIISHDLKAPMFALRTLFQQMSEQGTSKEELESFMPCIINDLNYATVLVENLLEWAKSQMQSDNVRPQELDINKLVKETVQLLGPQFRNKNIEVTVLEEASLPGFADKDMIRLVLRNLISNAIKFTPENGRITIGTAESNDIVEVYIKDSGKGITKEQLKKINKSIFYSTSGTNNETGTGLGLMLCKEFLVKNESKLVIESEPGKGSTFSFTLPAA